MIDRGELSGVGMSVVAHAGLLALIWYLSPLNAPPPEPATGEFQVTLTDDVGLVSAAPEPSNEPPAQAAQGEPEAAPDPVTPEPDPERVPDPRPQPTPRPNQTNSNARNIPVPTPGRIQRPSLTDGPATEATNGRGQQSQAEMTGEAQMNIVTAIQRQVQPCANRQVIPAQEATEILAIVQLRLNRDGSFAGLRIVRHEGVNDANERYVDRVDDAVQAIFSGCTPIRNLPPELYDVPRGWRQITFKYRLRQR